MSGAPEKHCPMCEIFFTGSFKNHNKVCERRQMQCKTCLFYFDHEDIKDHVKKYHTTRLKSCGRCSQKFEYNFETKAYHNCELCTSCEQWHVAGSDCPVPTASCGGILIPRDYSNSRIHWYECKNGVICTYCNKNVCSLYIEEHTQLCRIPTSIQNLRFSATISRPIQIDGNGNII